MNLLFLIIIFTSLGGVLSVLAASLFLLLPEKKRENILPHGVSFAIGALLAVSFWGLIPHAFELLKRLTLDVNVCLFYQQHTVRLFRLWVYLNAVCY